MSTKCLRLRLGVKYTLDILVPCRYIGVRHVRTTPWGNYLMRTYRLGFAEVRLFTQGTVAAYHTKRAANRLKRQEKEAVRLAQEPFILLRPAFSPTASAKRVV